MTSSIYDTDPDRPSRREDDGPSEQAQTQERAGRTGQSDYPDKLGYGRRRRDRDLNEIDRLHCQSQGDKKRYEYLSPELEAAMRLRETQFDTAQEAYAAARATAEPAAAAARAEIDKVIEQLRCMIGEDQERLDQAWTEVQVRLDRCAGDPGPCIDDDCRFNHDVHDTPLSELRARQAEYDGRVTRAETRFDELVGEPTNVATRVTNLQTEVSALLTDLGTDPEQADHSRTYVKALVAKHHAEVIWQGFDSTNLYDDCLRKCLRCSIRGRRALTAIVGEIAVRECRANKRKERCTWLENHLVDEVMAESEELEAREKLGHSSGTAGENQRTSR